MQATIKTFGATGNTGESKNDMLFHESTSGPHGGYFQILQEAHHTKEDLARAKLWLRKNHDVNHITVVHEFTLSIRQTRDLLNSKGVLLTDSDPSTLTDKGYIFGAHPMTEANFEIITADRLMNNSHNSDDLYFVSFDDYDNYLDKMFKKHLDRQL